MDQRVSGDDADPDPRTILGASARTDRNGGSYVTLTAEAAGAGGKITVQMDVTRAGVAARALAESEAEAVDRMRAAGYREWPPEFVQPEFPREADAGKER